MKSILIVFSLIVMLISCREKKVNDKQVIKSTLPDESVYWMDNSWRNQDGEEIHLKNLRGKVVVFAMMFTSCKSSCPRLVADVQHIEDGLDNAALKNTTFVLCSIDPEYDTPSRLKNYALEHGLPPDHWILLTSDKESVQELSALLGVKYKKTSPFEFSHSNIISVFNKNGALSYQQEGIENESQTIIKKITQLSTK